MKEISFRDHVAVRQPGVVGILAVLMAGMIHAEDLPVPSQADWDGARQTVTLPSGQTIGYDRVLADPLACGQAQRRAGACEEGLASAEHDGVEIQPILVDQAPLGQAVRQFRPGHVDLFVKPRLEAADRRC